MLILKRELGKDVAIEICEKDETYIKYFLFIAGVKKATVRKLKNRQKPCHETTITEMLARYQMEQLLWSEN